VHRARKARDRPEAAGAPPRLPEVLPALEVGAGVGEHRGRRGSCVAGGRCIRAGVEVAGAEGHHEAAARLLRASKGVRVGKPKRCTLANWPIGQGHSSQIGDMQGQSLQLQFHRVDNTRIPAGTRLETAEGPAGRASGPTWRRSHLGHRGVPLAAARAGEPGVPREVSAVLPPLPQLRVAAVA
jgi:hypothetical protein